MPVATPADSLEALSAYIASSNTNSPGHLPYNAKHYVRGYVSQSVLEEMKRSDSPLVPLQERVVLLHHALLPSLQFHVEYEQANQAFLSATSSEDMGRWGARLKEIGKDLLDHLTATFEGAHQATLRAPGFVKEGLDPWSVQRGLEKDLQERLNGLDALLEPGLAPRKLKPRVRFVESAVSSACVGRQALFGVEVVALQEKMGPDELAIRTKVIEGLPALLKEVVFNDHGYQSRFGTIEARRGMLRGYGYTEDEEPRLSSPKL